MSPHQRRSLYRRKTGARVSRVPASCGATDSALVDQALVHRVFTGPDALISLGGEPWMTTTLAHTMRAADKQRHGLDPMRGIFVSLGLGAVGWVALAAMTLALRALFT